MQSIIKVVIETHHIYAPWAVHISTWQEVSIMLLDKLIFRNKLHLNHKKKKIYIYSRGFEHNIANYRTYF